MANGNEQLQQAVLRKAKEARLVQKFASLTVFKRNRKILKKQLLASSCLSVHLSVRMEQLGSHWTDFQVFWFWMFRSFFKVQRSVQSTYIPFGIFTTRCNITQFIYFWKTALHVSGDISTHPQEHTNLYVVCPKSKCTDLLFKCLLDSPEITSYLLQSMTLGKLHSGSNVFFTYHNSTGSHFP